MSASTLRAAMVPVTRQMRAYFAPVNRVTETPTIFDPGVCGMFALDAPPAPWLDLGWVENFERWYDTPTDVVRSGAKNLPAAQFRGALEARVGFDFCEWGKLQMALACGSEHMNVLAPAAGSVSPAPSGGVPAPGVAVLPGSTASMLVFGAGSVNAFPVGTLIAVDMDYQQQVGYVGTGIAAAYVSSAAAVMQDPNYVRRVTFNVGRVAEVTATSAVLAQPLLGGAPLAGASAQAVVAFVDREGGSFFQEWSALFVAQEASGGRVCFYYPRLSPNPGNGGVSWSAASVGTNSGKSVGSAKNIAPSGSKFMREGFSAIEKNVATVSLRGAFLALPFVDTNDSQSVVCYRSYFPAVQAGVY
jgi:hypothetical protein